MKDNNKEIYRDYCRKRGDLHFYHQPWWLDTVCGPENWNVCIAKDKGNQITGTLIYYFQKKGPFGLIRMPILTPYSGINYIYPIKIVKPVSIYAFEKKTAKELFSQLPIHGFFNQHFSPSIGNALPFHWLGYETHIMYTKVILLQRDMETLEKDMKASTRNEIRKAKEKYIFSEQIILEDFLNVHEKTFSHQGINVPISNKEIRNCYDVLIKNQKVKIFGVYTQSNKLAASVFTVFDLDTIYTLMIGSDPKWRAGGAVQFLLWSLINNYQRDYVKLDFCGSMIEDIERVFRAMGGEQVSYIKVRCVHNILLKLSRILINKPA